MTDPQLTADTNFLIAMLVDDLKVNKPAYVLVDAQDKMDGLAQANFDYVKYFSQTASFQQVWQSYQYFATLENPPLYKFIVYKRV